MRNLSPSQIKQGFMKSFSIWGLILHTSLHSLGIFLQTRRLISYRTFGNAHKNDKIFRKHVAHKGNGFVQFVASVTSSDICDVMQSQGTSPVSTKARAYLCYDLVDFVFVIWVISAGFSISPIVSFTR